MAPTIVTRAGWGARAPKSAPSKTTWSRRTGFAIHHSAGPTNQTVRQIQNFQMDTNGWSDIGYNFLVDQSGKVYEGRSGGWLAIGAHAGGQNTAWIGVCWIGHSGNVTPTSAALAAIRWLYDEANQLAGRRLDVRGHGQVPGQATKCPGSRLREWIADGLPVKEESTLSWTERLKLPQWVIDRWGDWATGTATAGGLQTSTYGQARYSRDLLFEMRPKVDAILAAVGGADVVAAVQATVRETIREEITSLGPELAEHLDGVSVEQVVEAMSRLRFVADGEG